MKRVPNNTLEYPGDDGLYYHEGVSFTGTSYFLAPDSSITAEHEYRDGMRSGTSRAWWRPGSLECEEQYAWGLLHGLRREWHREGRLAAEELFEYGICVRGQRWDEAGNLREDFRLLETDADFDTLLMYRAAYQKAEGGSGK